MRARFLDALIRPFADIKTASEKLEHFREPVIVIRDLEAKADMAERALETLSLGLTVAEVYFDARSAEDEEDLDE